LNSAAKSVELFNVQMRRGAQCLFSAPLNVRMTSGRLNILVGKNGSGKSSLLDIVTMRVRLPDGAREQRVGHSQSIEIAYLPQQLWDVFDIRVEDIAALACKGARDCDFAGRSEFKVLKSRSRMDLGELSGGQRQLFLFGLVSSQKKGVFVYDEPFRHLDEDATGCVTKIIESQVLRGDLVIVSEHSWIARWKVECSRIELAGASPVNECNVFGGVSKASMTS